MTFAYWMVPVAALMPYLTVVMAKAGRGYDNRAPRDWATRLEGMKRRAMFAHQNHFEAFPAFAAGVIIAHATGAEQPTVDLLAGVFIAARIAYTAAYLWDRPAMRSLVWFVGLGCVVGLFVASAAAG